MLSSMRLQKLQLKLELDEVGLAVAKADSAVRLRKDSLRANGVSADDIRMDKEVLAALETREKLYAQRIDLKKQILEVSKAMVKARDAAAKKKAKAILSGTMA